MLPEDIIKSLRKHAVKNAIDFGKAKQESVMGKVIRSVKPDQVAELKEAAATIVMEVNSLSDDDLWTEYQDYKGEFEEQRRKTAESTSRPRMALEGAEKGSFVTRFAPEPSGYMHIGHASAAFLAEEFSRIYEGKMLLYFDDTNPEKETQEFVDAIKGDLEWLGIKFDRECYASDNMESIYGRARELIGLGKAYACECSSDETKKNRFESIECRHRGQDSGANLEMFEMMLANGYDEERIVIRFKGDMGSQNTALRDPTILRIKKSPHYRQGSRYVVWPTYDFNTPINDSMNGVTDAIRTKEYEQHDELDMMILDALKMRMARIHSHARLSVKGQPRQKREIRKLIADGLMKGFDDPRLVTIAALRRRGVQPSAIREFVLGFGMTKVDTTVGLESLFAENKKAIDPHARRLYYVPAPVQLQVLDFAGKNIEPKLHPSEDLGSRKIAAKNMFYVSGEDATNFGEGENIRLKELFNVEVRKGEDYLEGTIKPDREVRKKLQWVCDGNKIQCSILVPSEPLDSEGNFRRDSLQTNSGYIESYASNLNKGDIVQLERFGFCVLDDKDAMRFIFISK